MDFNIQTHGSKHPTGSVIYYYVLVLSTKVVPIRIE